MPLAFGCVQRTRRSCRANSHNGCLLVAQAFHLHTSPSHTFGSSRTPGIWATFCSLTMSPPASTFAIPIFPTPILLSFTQTLPSINILSPDPHPPTHHRPPKASLSRSLTTQTSLSLTHPLHMLNPDRANGSIKPPMIFSPMGRRSQSLNPSTKFTNNPHQFPFSPSQCFPGPAAATQSWRLHLQVRQCNKNSHLLFTNPCLSFCRLSTPCSAPHPSRRCCLQLILRSVFLLHVILTLFLTSTML